MIRAALMSHHVLCRESLQQLLSTVPDLVVDTLPPDGAALFDGPRADVVILAAHGASGSTRSLVERIVAADRGPVLFIGDLESAYDVACMRAAGARGVVCWSQSAKEAFDAIRLVAAGRSYVPPRLAPRAAGPVDPEILARHPLACLTPREREVFVHVINGCSNAVVGARLGISAKTADTHRAHLMRKLGVHSAVHLVRFAARHRLLDDPLVHEERSLA